MTRQAITRDDRQRQRRHPESPRTPVLDHRMTSTKQLRLSVLNGRKIEFQVFDRDNHLPAYLAGMDQFDLFVLEPLDGYFEEHVLRRDCIPAMRICKESTYDDEPLHDQMDKIIGPFRSAMTKPGTRHPGGES